MAEFEGSDKYMSKQRLETLVDGIFAIAMTLLVLIYLFHILAVR